MSNSTEATDPSQVSLGEVAGTVKLSAIKDVLAKLNRLGARFYVSIPRNTIALWVDREQVDGSLEPVLIERVNDFSDNAAIITSATLVKALASDQDLIEIKSVYSDLTGMWGGSRDNKRYYEVLLDSPVLVNISSLLVESHLANALPKMPAVITASVDTTATDCVPLKLSEGWNNWHEAYRARWTDATISAYKGHVSLFIDIVGDKLTTELTPKDFSGYDAIVRKLPKDWLKIQGKTKATLAQIAKDAEKGGREILDHKTIKAKGTALAAFFTFLQGQGYWHGRFGNSLFKGVVQTKTKVPAHNFTNEELQNIYAGKGIEKFKKAKFALYVWGSILLLYTGARAGEISQLQRKDVIEDDDGTWYLSINNEGTRKKIKNSSSKRSVPIHQTLVDLGFLKFIEKFKADDHLFPEFNRHTQRSYQEMSDWYSKLLEAVLLKRKGVSLHCLRHTVIERFKADATMDHYAHAYVGHRNTEDRLPANKVYANVYGRSHKPKALADKLHPLLDYSIDWEPMKKVILALDKSWDGERRLLAKKTNPTKAVPKTAAKVPAKSSSKATPNTPAMKLIKA